MSLDSIPSAFIRPLLLLGGIGLGVVVYLYLQGQLTEEKIVDKIAEHRDEPLTDLHKNTPSGKLTNNVEIQPLSELEH